MGRKNRVRSRQSQPPTQKSTWLPYNMFGGDVLPYLHAVPTNYDWDGEGGRVEAFKHIGTINRCVKLIADASHSMPWQIVRGKGKQKEVVCTSEDRNPSHPLAKAIQNVFKRQGQPLFALMSYSTLINGETYLEKIIDGFGFSRLKWLNPLVTEPIIISGNIAGFRYMPMNGGTGHNLTAEQVAYYHTFSGDDDLRGHSSVEAAMREINLDRSVYSYVKNTLWNNARPGLILAPASDANSGLSGMFTPLETQALERQANDFHRGTQNANNALISPRPLNVTPLDPPDLDRYYSILDPNTRKIAMIFGTPLAMLGDSNASTYKDGKDVRDSFYINTVIPHCRLIGDFINIDVMPEYAESHDDTFEFDTSEFEDTSDAAKSELEVNNGRLQSGYITLADAARAQGLDPAPELEGLVMIEGTPVPLSEVGNLWKVKFAAPVPSFGFGQSAPMPDTSRLEIREPETPQLPARAEYQFEKPLPVAEWREKALNELKAWQRHVKEGRTRAFEPVYLRGDIADSLSTPTSDAFDQAFSVVRHAPFKATQSLLTQLVTDGLPTHDSIKAWADTKQEFEDEILLTIDDARSGALKQPAFESLMKRLIRSLGEQAYLDGLTDGGVDGSELGDDGRKEVDALIAQQDDYADALATQLYTTGISDAQFDRKPEMWVNRTLTPFYQAGLAAADANGMFEWKYGDTEHCADCLRLNGQRHRMKDWIREGWLPQSNGTKDLECHGYNCKCTLVLVRGRSRGNF